ncbi:cytochrome c oxidase assembly protein [Pseudomonas sp. 8Z]|uniref:cytochrome c oxidase assembly protein n=1 Tax=Pseudomonas sp. 8Z TaxID=2653166 RepID=UPI0013587CA1|nr:cytochrome c oxidase assembly protein [Pseudomonas sp. 8Z]
MKHPGRAGTPKRSRVANASNTPRLLVRLLAVVVIMFSFGLFVLPRLNDAMRSALDIDGGAAGAQPHEREVRVQFLASNAAGMIWAFAPKAEELQVRPGEPNDMLFVAYNPSDTPMTAQAVPGISPARAAAFFHKTECFCFTQQVLQPGERIEMPVRFIIDRDLPADVKHLSLSYTLFDISAPQAAMPQASQ